MFKKTYSAICTYFGSNIHWYLAFNEFKKSKCIWMLCTRIHWIILF